MEVLHPRCAGIDVHKDSVSVCLRTVEKGKIHQEVKTFSTMTKGLLELLDWLEKAGCTHVAMESTGVYWKPVWHVLEGHFQLLLANATHIRNVPGRKSDVSDAMWIADLLAHGLIHASFIPPKPIQELRDLTRTRKQLTREIVQHTLRIQRVLEDSNVKLSSVITDILGVSGRKILKALITGETNLEVLASLGNPRLHCTREELTEALRGRITNHHRFLLRHHLTLIEALERTVADFDSQIGRVLEPFRPEVELLTSIPGVSEIAAQVIIAEIGVDMKVFPTDTHLVSWAGLCPGMNESGGKRLSTRLRKGAPWLKTLLVQCAWAAARAKGTYLQAQFLRLRARRGPKKAAVAVAASILTGVWHILDAKVPWKELGPEHFAGRERAVMARRLVRRIKELGYDVQIQDQEAA